MGSFHHTLAVILIVVYSLTITAAIVANGLLLWTLVKSKSLKIVPFRLILCLLISDLIFVIPYLPFEVTGLFVLEWQWPHGEVWCRIFNGLYFLTRSVIAITLCALTFSVIWFRKKMTSADSMMRTQNILVFFVWFVSLITAVPGVVYSYVEEDMDSARCTMNMSIGLWAFIIYPGLFHLLPVCLLIGGAIWIARNKDTDTDMQMKEGMKIILIFDVIYIILSLIEIIFYILVILMRDILFVFLYFKNLFPAIATFIRPVICLESSSALNKALKDLWKKLRKRESTADPTDTEMEKQPGQDGE